MLVVQRCLNKLVLKALRIVKLRVCQAVNVNADTFASALAQTCNASKIIFLTDVDGLYRDFSDKSSLISRLTAADAQALVDSGTLSKGMIPKVRAVLDAIDGGVERAHILNGTVEHSNSNRAWTVKRE